MQQGSTNTGRTKSHFLAGYLCHSNGVHDIGFTRESAHTLMGLSCKVEGLGNNIHLLTVTRLLIAVQQMLERIIYQFLIGIFSSDLLIHNYYLLLFVDLPLLLRVERLLALALLRLDDFAFVLRRVLVRDLLRLLVLAPRRLTRPFLPRV